MDSITQIVLGAACGEAVLGKKIGNRALLFGAIGGTIPDLDVFTSQLLYNNEIDIMAAHRGFSHSIVFAILGAFAFGYLFYWIYNTQKRRGTTLRRDWIKLSFWSLFTHMILDAFTPYGTQLFLPFSDFRVAFNNISVADPSYTIPFLICMIVMMFFKRTSTRRRTWLSLALGISTVYMIWTIGNKIYMNQVFKKSLLSENIEAIRYSTQPTILNNILWYGIAETETDYYIAFYSFFDESQELDWKQIEKQHDLGDLSHPDIEKLQWFSNGYFNFQPIEASENLKYNDLRYMMVDDGANSQFVFSFELFKDQDRYDAKPFRGAPPNEGTMKIFFNRIKGIK